MCREQLPRVVFSTLCRQMCAASSGLDCRHFPIVFLTQKDERADKIQGLELGADDYLTIPFDVEEVRLRVYNRIERARHPSLMDPTTGLPGARLIEEQLICCCAEILGD